jgi:cardiolipin synthase
MSPLWPRIENAVLAVLIGCLLAACVSLPQVTDRSGQKPVAGVRIVGAEGTQSAQDSAAHLDRLKREAGGTQLLDHHLAVEEAIVASPLVSGNQVTLLEDGDATYRSMFAAIRSARNHINLETYILEDDEIGWKVAQLLIGKRARGVQVNVIYDSVGAIKTPRAFFDHLRKAGIHVAEFNPVNPLNARRGWRINNRDHRKLLVVDGRVAFVGGINISGVYSSASTQGGSGSGGAQASAWRDTHARIEGPVVKEFQKLFLETWKEATGGEPPHARYFPPLKPQGRHVVRALASLAGDPQSPIYATLLSAVMSAQESVHITSAYFVPDPQTIEVFKEAARRGVDVKLLLPSHTDAWVVIQAGRSHYTELLEAGVQIYERRGALLHAKTAVIDGVWSSIGSANWDPRSFIHNNELNGVILGNDFARQMQEMFERDLRNSERIELHNWKHRPLFNRATEQLARLWGYWL